MNKYDQLIMPIYNGEGIRIGSLVRKRTPEQFAQERWELAKLRKLFNDSIKDTKNIYRTPIFSGPRLVDPKEE